jgi:hypothetical protein
MVCSGMGSSNGRINGIMSLFSCTRDEVGVICGFVREPPKNRTYVEWHVDWMRAF